MNHMYVQLCVKVVRDTSWFDRHRHTSLVDRLSDKQYWPVFPMNAL